jgi:lipopolysaccharide export system permease protein
MRLLDRYLIRELLVPLGYCLSGFLAFWVSFELISDLDSFQAAKLSALEIALYYLLKLPDLFGLILPIALLLALLYTLTNHSRHHELVAIRAAGISLWRLSAPYLLVGLIFSIVLFASNEFLAPEASERAERLLHRYQLSSGDFAGSDWQRNLVFRNDRDNRDWHISAYNLKTFEMISPKLAWRKPDGTRVEMFAQKGVWTNGVWTFRDVQTHLYKNPAGGSAEIRRTTNDVTLPELSETPEQIKSEIKISSLSHLSASKKVQLSLAEILNYKRLHRNVTARTRALLETQLHGRLAAPWTSLVVSIIAIPFGAQTGRRNVYVGVASSVFLCFAYFVLMRLGIALGTGGYLTPWLAAWLPNLLFASAGLFLIPRVS